MTVPLTLGVFDVGPTTAAAESVGFKPERSPSAADRTKAIVHYYNTHGGIAGRQIRLVEYTLTPTDNSYEIAYEAACAKFTQDNRVDAVITYGANIFDSYHACLDKARIVNIDTGGGDDEFYARYPRMFTTSFPTKNRSITAVLTGLGDRGFLTSKNNVGVIVEDCPYNLRAYAATFQPLARRLGFTVVRRDVDCWTGFGELGRFASQVASAVLPFQTAGVDRITFVTNFESLALLAFTQQAHAQGYYPWYALSSFAQVGPAGSSYASDQLPRMTGVGHVPILDVTDRMSAGRLSGWTSSKRCESIYQSEGLSERPDYSQCAQFFLLEAALIRSNGHTGSSLVGALASLGRSFVSPLSLGGATYYDATHHDGTRLFSIFAYKTSCECFVYTTKPAELA